MIKYKTAIITVILVCISSAQSAGILIPMDLKQNNHLKAYGVAYWTLERGLNVRWLLNYRSGSFLIEGDESIKRRCSILGVSCESVSSSKVASILHTIENNNMEVVLLEKSPSIAVYVPPNHQPWDDAVTLSLTYAEIPFDKVWDKEILEGNLSEYDWLHLHHEDFTGQYGKFYGAYRNTPWYIQQQQLYEKQAKRLGFSKVSRLKLAVALKIKDYIRQGGFMFAMCSATDSYDIALAAQNTDICDVVFDGDPLDPEYKNKLDYSQCLAFENFELITQPTIYEYSNIDTTPLDQTAARSGREDYFTLFEFSAKYDPVPTMLTQDHVSVIHNFMGQTTAYHKDVIKENVVIMAEKKGTDEVKYIHGNCGKGTFTFLGGHDPEDYRHYVGDPPTDLNLHKNSPGYRLILNNILFPAARKKKLKT
ncbi:MAG: asparagine synthetase B [bacterium]